MAQFGISNTRISQGIAAFLLFFVLTRPETAGPQAGAFFRWIGDALEALLVFVNGVFADQPPPN